jgi:hypothetical protein
VAKDDFKPAAPPPALAIRLPAAAAAPRVPYLEDDNMAAAAPPVQPSGNDPAIKEAMTYLEEWALANKKDYERDLVRFWSLKLPAIVCAATISGLEGFGFHAAVSVLGIVSAICVAVDAALPRGLLYNVHRRAFNELRNVNANIRNQWNIAKVKTEDDPSARRAAVIAILDYSQRERERINKYLTDAEASLGGAAQTQTPASPPQL